MTSSERTRPRVLRLPERPARVVVAGVAVDPVTLAEAVDHVALELAGPRHSRPALVITANVDQTLHVSANPELAEAYRRAALVLADGAPVVALSRLLGAPVPERVCGSDLMPALCDRAAVLGWRVGIVGGAPGVAQRAGAALTRRYPGLVVALTSAPPLGFESDLAATATVLHQVREASLDLAFLCVGSPKSELFAARLGSSLAVGAVVCVGAAVDYAAGSSRRAPRLLQRAGLEWVWRLAAEPRRLAHRYLVRGPRYLALVVRALRAPHPVRVPHVLDLRVVEDPESYVLWWQRAGEGIGA